MTAIDTIASMLGSPHLIDLILALTLAEAIVVVLCRGLSPLGAARMLLPGVFLLLAVRSALAGTAWPWLPLALAAALIAHLVDLRERWRR